MSGAEVISVLGLVANIVQVVDFTCKVLERITDATQQTHEVPKAFRIVHLSLPLLGNALNYTEERANSGALDERSCKALRPVLEDCFSKINDLKKIFESCLPEDNSSSVARGWKALVSLKYDKKVDEISKFIQQHIALLTYHHVSTPATVTQAVNANIVGLADLAIDSGKKLRRHYMVPVHWADDFTGREKQLDIIEAKLRAHGKHTRVAVVGLGGIGKTRLVMQYIERYKDSEISVFWIHAGSAERMKTGSQDVAKKIGIPRHDDSDIDILKLIKDWFESEESGHWLLVYDNVDDVDLMYNKEFGRLSAYFPKSDNGSVLLTTRNKQVGIKFATAKNLVALEAMTQDEAIALVAARLGDDEEQVPQRAKLVETLAGIPLALVQATSFIQENATTIDRYLELYEGSDANKVHLLSQDFEDDMRDPELKNPIAATWIVTLEYIQNHHPLAADTLCMMSMFESQAVPEIFVIEIAQGTPASAINVDRALGVLLSYSLITDRPASTPMPTQLGRLFDIHRLVRLATRNWLINRSEYTSWFAKAIDMLSTKYDSLAEVDFSAYWWAKSSFLPHAVSLISSTPLFLNREPMVIPEPFQGQTLQDHHARTGDICPFCTANILAKMFTMDRSAAQKLQMTRKSIAICKHTYGDTHQSTLDYRYIEAKILNRLKCWSEAEQIYRAILERYSSTLGPNHASTLSTQKYLAKTLSYQGAYEEAELLLKPLLEQCKHRYGENHEIMIEAMQTMSMNLARQGRDEEAAQMNRRVSQLTHNLWSKYLLAKSYSTLSQYSEAENLCLEILDDQDALAKEKNLSIADVWGILGDVYEEQRMYDKAEPVLLMAVQHRRKLYGEHNIITAGSILDLARNYHLQGSYDKAETIRPLAVEYLKDHYGEKLSKLISKHWNLAHTELQRGKVNRSRRLAEQTVISFYDKENKEHEKMLDELRTLWGVTLEGPRFTTSDPAVGAIPP